MCGQKFHVRERRADDEQRVATLHRILRGRRAEESEAAGRQRVVVGHDLFAEQSLHNRSAELVGYLYDFLSSTARALSDEYDGLRRLIEDDCGEAQLLF